MKSTDQTRDNWWPYLAMLSLALATVFVAYHSSYLSLVQKWSGDAAFSHGFLILPISLWLVWRKRDEISRLPVQPSAFGIVAVLACVLAWVIARGSGVLVIEQAAAVCLIPALVLTAFGRSVTRALIFPLAFLLFMVPFGRGLVPSLMQITADFSALLLQWSGVPVLRSHMLISIPSGNFEVARACSGLNYFITSSVLGVLYAYLNFTGWRKRIICVAAFLVIPVILNGLRVYFTILVSHWTEMRFGPGAEHVTFGRIFFVVMMVAMFWIGRRWHDEVAPAAGQIDGIKPLSRASWLAWWPLPLACAVALAGPPLVDNTIAQARSNLAAPSRLIALPEAVHGWQGPLKADDLWRPLYRGGIVERQARYVAPDQAALDVFVAVYGLGNSVGAEMISYSNVIAATERKSLASEVHHKITLADRSQLTVREVELSVDGQSRVVWYWFVVGDRPVTREFAAKALEAIAFVTRNADSERIVTLSTASGAGSRERLTAFLEAHGACAAQGFAPEACPR